MTSLRSSEVDSLLTRKKLVGNVLPTNQEVIQHYYHVRQFLINTEPKFSRIPPGFNNIQELVMSDIVKLWRKASLTVIEAKSIQKKLKNIHNKFTCARKSYNSIKNQSALSSMKTGFSNCLTYQNVAVIFRIHMISTKVNCFVTATLIIEYQKRKLLSERSTVVQKNDANFI